MKKHFRLLYLFLAVITLVLEIIPFGIHMFFRPEPNRRVDAYYSFFSIAPVGYGIISGFIIGLLTIIIVLLSLFSLKKEKRKKYTGCCILSGIAVLFFFFGIFLYGIDVYTILGICVGCLLIFLFLGALYGLNGRRIR